MIRSIHEYSIPRIAFWRNTEVRAVFYQIVILGACIGAGYVIFRNTLDNLAALGIASGFGFLKNEAGFGISEVLPIPQLEGGFLYFLLSVFGGLLAVYGLSKWVAFRGKTIGTDTRLVLVSIGLLFVVPGVILYTTGHTIRTKTYTESNSYALALITGLFNTLKVSVLGCILATIFGLLIGIARLSSNWLVSRLTAVYIEVIRNIPLLLQLFFWYFAVLRSLPNVRQSITLYDIIILNNRGVYLPSPSPEASFPLLLIAVFVAGVAIYLLARYARQKQEETGQQIPVLYPALALLLGLPGLVWLIAGAPLAFTFPVLEGFNYQGGMALSPEYAALLVALTLYTTAFIGEIVRSGIQAVPRGQTEAASALGLKKGLVLRLVVIPQALRVIIPPLTSQYLNLTKNSSLGVAIAYPELVSVGGTSLNQSGQAVEIIGLTMAVYLTFSLLISLGMNWYNAKVKLVER